MPARSVGLGAFIVAATTLVPLVFLPAAGLASQIADDVLTVAIRSRGVKCPDPVTADPDTKASRPDETAWIVHCKEGDFRVIFKGDTGAAVERLEH
jgi:hypothetical protein